jgi:signal transduction histidine kinase/DNA-binding response OmpR family regulator
MLFVSSLLPAQAMPTALDESAALDLAEVSTIVPDDGHLGSDDLVAELERGEPGATPSETAGGPVWMAARLTNPTGEKEWVLYLRNAFFDRIDVWVYDGKTLLSQASAGIGLRRSAARPRFALGYEFPIVLPPGGERIVVMRLAPVSSLDADPMLASVTVARLDSAWRRILFPLLLGSFIGFAALHVIVFMRFRGLANLLFAATVFSIFLDWFVWLGGVHDLGVDLSVAASEQLSSVTWFVATFFILAFCLNFFTFGRHTFASYAALLGAFVVFVILSLATESPDWQLIEINLFLVISAAIIVSNAVVAIRHGVSGAWLALAAYSIELFNELSTYAGVVVPWLADFSEWMKASLGVFDVETLLSQIVMNGLFSMALWERVRTMTREREAAIHAERLKTVHLAQLGHDIRSPLHAVQSVVAALIAKAPAVGAEQRQVEAVQSSVRSVIGMLDDLVDLAKSEVATRGRNARVDLRGLVDDAAAVARAEIGERPVAVRVDIAEDVPLEIGGDGVAIRRVIGNLLSNAVRVSSRGSIAIAVAFLVTPAARVRFKISDAGPGMTEHRINSLFATGEGEGSGFGLRVAKRLVNTLGGTLSAESRLGAGTSVWFDVPASSAPDIVLRPNDTPGNPAAISGLRLLLVEDDGLTAAATAAVLSADGHEVAIAGAAAEAIDLAARLSFDLVLMDLGLDAGSGLDAIRAIRALDDPVRSGVPIVVATADPAKGEAALNSALAVRSLLIKPFDLEELRRAIASALGFGGKAYSSGGNGAGFLADFAAILAPGDLKSLLETGREQIELNAQALLTASLSQPPRDAARFAHRLAGSAGILGFVRLTTAARLAESAASSAETERLTLLLRDVGAAAEEALAELAYWLTPASTEPETARPPAVAGVGTGGR